MFLVIPDGKLIYFFYLALFGLVGSLFYFILLICCRIYISSKDIYRYHKTKLRFSDLMVGPSDET